MKTSDLAHRGLVMLGCGKMGSAMLEGWLARGLPASSVWITDPNPSDWVRNQHTHLNADLPPDPAVVLIAVKPQVMADALPVLKPLGNRDTLFLSVAAGIPIATYETMLGAETPVIRAMPNTPAAVGQGITAIVGNARTTEEHMAGAEQLLSAVGSVVRLSDEGQMDAVTGLSGSGPAYVFHLIECLAAAGTAQGLAPDLAMALARETVAGAGALARQSHETPEQLRRNVTSPGGTTQAGLDVLMDPTSGLSPLIRATVAAATKRSRDLANG
ncbi:pyrroline-5-carboxylate reductase [Thalassococcus sp. CAU 1522]|uniref:Pyrroline-5-carboxylate reductase n=1 Tax=Thalassococcus arenae TaxID=2851652 RepID=A0ABS6N701_9RHOB|nr:pyrroline-5-carboxylate reductase [Thalassococcus arenae]MBV2359793.1 pyrroline-5-carboxylate reductase [Thalassococcus arenae]